jgi:hypothetical protein
MTYTQKDFGLALNKKLKKEPFDIVNISRWCSRIYFDHLKELDDKLYKLIFELSTMEDDPQFEYTKQELESLAEELINNDEDPLKQITM